MPPLSWGWCPAQCLLGNAAVRNAGSKQYWQKGSGKEPSEGNTQALTHRNLQSLCGDELFSEAVRAAEVARAGRACCHLELKE